MTALRAFIVATALVSFLSSPAFAANEQFLTGLELAIQHFNAKGERELKSWGPEHTYMMKVLEAVEKELPQLKGVTKAGTYGADSKYMSLAFSADTLEVDIASIEEVQALSEALVEGCGYRRESQISEQDLGFTPPSRSISVETTYELSSRGTRKCTSSDANVLSGLPFGLNRFVIKTEKSRFRNSFTASLEVGVNTWQDMRYVKSQLMTVPGLNRELLTKLNPPEAPRMIGVSSDIQLVGSSGQGSFNDALTLVYYQGSGDCPAGCIQRVYSTVKVEPQFGTDPKKPVLKVTLVDVK